MNRDDDAMVEDLARIAALVDPPPAGVAAAARAAFAWRTADVELAELVYDSWLDDQALTGVRSTSGPHRFTFAADGLTLEVEVVEGAGGARRLVGQLVPPGPGAVEVRSPGGSVEVPVDRLGRFSVAAPDAAHLSLRCRSEGSKVIDTAWVVA